VRTKFESWWRKRSHAPPPKTAEEAVLLAEEGLLAMPSKIVVKSVAGEKFDRVVDCEFRSIPEWIPEPGWNDERPCEFEEADNGDFVPF